ncbi:hypothetical protein [Martelella mangrovi]|uniref:Uncharacterized protein n=1 Tax=Martelella mangrovi TaxID=1397477 RepID=A0ABV2IG48_9HYPH
MIIDSISADKKIIVNTKWLMINSTADDTTYPDTIALTDDALKARAERIPRAIAAAWNALPYQISITDEKCGEHLFTVVFNVEIVTAGPYHYAVNFVNVKTGNGIGVKFDANAKGITSGRSYVLSGSSRAKFNVSDPRTATDSNPKADTLEPHEYGHMLGLIDEYFEAQFNRGGVRYTYFDGSKEIAMPGNGGMMDNMRDGIAKRKRYALTIGYNAVRILKSNGIKVTKMEIVNGS